MDKYIENCFRDKKVELDFLNFIVTLIEIEFLQTFMYGLNCY